MSDLVLCDRDKVWSKLNKASGMTRKELEECKGGGGGGWENTYESVHFSVASDINLPGASVTLEAIPRMFSGSIPRRNGRPLDGCLARTPTKIVLIN